MAPEPIGHVRYCRVRMPTCQLEDDVQQVGLSPYTVSAFSIKGSVLGLIVGKAEFNCKMLKSSLTTFRYFPQKYLLAEFMILFSNDENATPFYELAEVK